MNIIEAVKTIYADSSEPAALLDSNYKLIWKNSEDIADDFSLKCLIFDSHTLGTLPSEETVFRHRNGSAVKFRPLRDESGICGYLAVFYDTETIHNLYCHSDKLKEQNVMLGNIRSGIADILLTANKMKEEPEQSPETAAAEIRRSVRTTLASLTNITYISAAYSTSVNTDLENISDGLTFISGEAAPILESEKCRLVTEISPGIYARLNFKLLEAAVINLITNAVMYSDASEKEIRLAMERKGAVAHITVSDNGTGADIQRIEKLSRFSGREIEYKNNECLGLPLARRVCEMFGGSISFSASETGGLKVLMQLPCEPAGKTLPMRSRRLKLPYMPFDPQLCILAKAVKDLGAD